MRHHHHHHHHHHHRRHSRFSSFWYWATGAAIIEAGLWAVALELIALWWLLWLAGLGATTAMKTMWGLTQPAGSGGPDWQRAIDSARPPWPKTRARRMVTR